jgi:hypothetical protein
MPIFFAMANALMRLEEDSLPSTGALSLDTEGLSFVTGGFVSGDVRLSYEQIASIGRLYRSKDTLVVTTTEGDRYLFTVHQEGTADGVRAIVRLLQARAEHLRKQAPPPPPEPEGGPGEEPGGEPGPACA